MWDEEKCKYEERTKWKETHLITWKKNSNEKKGEKNKNSEMSNWRQIYEFCL